MQRKIVLLAQAILIVALFYFCLLPILSVFFYGLNDLSILNNTLMARVLKLLKNSLFISLTVTFISVSLGIIVTFTLNRLRFQGKSVLKVLMLLPLVNPTFVDSIAFVMLFGKRGLITNKLLHLDVSPYGWQGIVVLQVLSLTTLAYLLISASIEQVDFTLEDAARNMGASERTILFKVTLPMMLPEIASAALLVFLASMADFSTPLMIGGSFRTLASDLYIQITGLYNMQSAAISGIVLLAPCFIAFFLERFLRTKKKYTSDTANSKNMEYPSISKPIKAALILCTVCIVSFFVIKFSFIMIGIFTKNWGYDYTFTLEHLKNAFAKDLRPYYNSVRLAFVTAAVASLLGSLLAFLINRKKIIGAQWVNFICVFPAAIPGILYGIGYLVTFKYPILGIGKYIFTEAEPLVLLGTSSIIYFICIARSLNMSLKTGYASLEHLDSDLENAAYNLGAGKIYTFTHVILPMLRDSFFNSFMKVFSYTMTTLGAIIFLLLPKNKVAVQVIFQMITNESIGTTASLAMMLSFLNLSLLLLFYLIIYWRNVFDKIEGRYLCKSK